MTVNNGVSSDIVATFADLPPPYSRRIGAIAHLANGQGYSVQAVAGVLTWVPDAGGGGGTVLKYVVAVAGSPQANADTFPNVEAAYAQAAIDFGGPLVRAEIMCQPGSYPGFRLRPGMHVGMFVDGGIADVRIPPVPNLDTPPLVFTGTIEVRAADGWNVGLGDPQPNASIANAKIATSGAASCLLIGAGVTTGLVSLSRCVLTPETGIAIEEVAGALTRDALTIACENVKIEAFGTIPALGVAFNGVNVRLQLFDSCRVQGSLSTQQAEGIVFSDTFMVRAPITASGFAPPPNTGSFNVRGIRSTMISIGDARPVLVLNDGCTAVFDGCAVQPNGATQTIDGTGGSVLLQSGSLPGFERAPAAISIFSQTSGGSLAVIPPGALPEQNAQGYIAPVGPGPFNIPAPPGLAIEEIVFDLTLCTGPVTLTLSDVREVMQYTRLAVDRIDNSGNVLATLTVQVTAPNEFNATSPATTSIAIPPLNRLSLVSSREPGGTGRWLASLSSAVPASGGSASPLRFFASPDVAVDTTTEFGTLGAAMTAANAAVAPANVIIELWPDTPMGLMPTMTRGLQIIGMSVGPQAPTITGSLLFTGGLKRIGIENVRIVPSALTGIGVGGSNNSVYLRNVVVETAVAGVQAVSFDSAGTGNMLDASDVSLETVDSECLTTTNASVKLEGVTARMTTSNSSTAVVNHALPSSLYSRNGRYAGAFPVQVLTPVGGGSYSFVNDEITQAGYTVVVGDVLVRAATPAGTDPTTINLVNCRLLNKDFNGITPVDTAHTTGPAHVTFVVENESDSYQTPGLQMLSTSLATNRAFGHYALGSPEILAPATVATGKTRWVIASGDATLPPLYPTSQSLVVSVSPAVIGTVTIFANAGQTILGGASITLSPGESRILVIDSVNDWWVVGSSAAGASLPDILYVTAQPAKYPGMSAAVLTSLPSALTNPAVLAAAAAGGVSLILLDDVYDVTAAATPTIPADLHLFAFSSGGARITSSAAQPTLFTAGNAKFENVSVENTGGLPAIRTTGNGTIDITGACEIVGDIDAATNDHALNLNLSGRVIVTGTVLGGATGALVIQSEDGFVGGVVGAAGSIQSHGGRYLGVAYTAAANITSDNTVFGPLDTSGTVTLQSCNVSAALGAVTPPSSLTMRECQADGAVTAGPTTVRGSTVSGLLTAQDLEIVNSSANGGVVSVGKCDVRFSLISGAMNSSSGAFDSFHNVFNGPVSSDGISDTGSEFRDTYTSTTAPSTFTGSYVFDVITLGAGQDAELRDCFVRVHVGATGAIVNAGGTVDLIDCYVRADDTFVSVSGTGNVRTTNRVSGGCRFDTSGGLVVLPTTSGVRARSQRGIDAPINVTSDDTIENLLGTAEVIDSVYLTPDANGWSVQEYPAAGFPVGYRHFIKNISGMFGVSIRPFGAGDTIDGLTFGGGGAVTVAPNTFIELEKVSATGWQTCS